MAITIPVPGQEINVANFGSPVANEVNRMTPLVVAPTAWTNFTLLGGWTHNANGAFQYRKVGDHVEFRGRIDNSSGQGFTNVSSLPAGYRPPRDVPFTAAIVVSGGWTGGCVQFSANGDVYLMTTCQSLAPSGQFSLTA